MTDARQPADETLSMIFATPLAIVDWPESDALNAELRDRIATLRRSGPGVVKSNVGGWHSAPDFIGEDAPPFAELRRRIRLMTGDLTKRTTMPGDYTLSIDGWANVLAAGDYNGPHNHPNATWSGVYYLTGVPADPELKDAPGLSGKIEFFDPRPAAGMVYAADNLLQRRCLFTPRPGCMLMFPAWLQHMVHPHRSPGERQSIAFNVTLQKNMPTGRSD